MKKLVCMLLCVCLLGSCLPAGAVEYEAVGDWISVNGKADYSNPLPSSVYLTVGETEQMTYDYSDFVSTVREEYSDGDLEFVCTVRVSNSTVADVEFISEGSAFAAWTVTALKGGSCQLTVKVEAYYYEDLVGSTDTYSTTITVEAEEVEEELEIDIPRIAIVDEDGNRLSDEETVPVGESRILSFVTTGGIVWRQGTVYTEKGMVRGTLGYDSDGGCYYILDDGVHWSEESNCLTLWETEDSTEIEVKGTEKGTGLVSVRVEFGYLANWDNEMVDLGSIGTAKDTVKIKSGSLLENPFKDIDISKVENPFEDVSEEDYFYESTMKMYAAGLLEGILLNDGTVYYSTGVKQLSTATGPVLQRLSGQEPFGVVSLAQKQQRLNPEEKESRGNMVMYLCKAAKVEPASYTANSFADVTVGLPYYHHVLWANATGIVKGYGDGTFGPKNSITREQFCTIMLRYAKKYGVSLTASVAAAPFVDASSVSGYAKEAVTILQKAGIILGVGGNRFAPKDTIRRCDIFEMLDRFFKLV